MSEIPRPPGRGPAPFRGGAGARGGGGVASGRGGGANVAAGGAAGSPGVRKFPPTMAPPVAPTTADVPPPTSHTTANPRPVSVMKQRPTPPSTPLQRPASYMPKSNVRSLEALGLETTSSPKGELQKRPQPPGAGLSNSGGNHGVVTRPMSTMVSKSDTMTALGLESSFSAKTQPKVQKAYSSTTVATDALDVDLPAFPGSKARPVPLKAPPKRVPTSNSSPNSPNILPIQTHARNPSEGGISGTRSIYLKPKSSDGAGEVTPMRPVSMKITPQVLGVISSAPLSAPSSMSEVLSTDNDLDDEAAVKEQGSSKKGMFSSTKFMDQLKKVSSDITSSGSAALKSLQKSIASPKEAGEAVEAEASNAAATVASVTNTVTLEVPTEPIKKKEGSTASNFRKSVLSALKPNQYKSAEAVAVPETQSTAGAPTQTQVPSPRISTPSSSPQVGSPSPRAAPSSPNQRLSVAPSSGALSSGGGVSNPPLRSSTGVGSPTPRSVVNEDDSSVDKRTKIVRELLSTEKTYVSQLEAMIEVYMKPLLQLAETPPDVTQNRSNDSRLSVKGLNLNSLIGSKGMKITPEDIRTMFSNVEQLLPINRELLNQLESRLNNWSDKQKIGDIFNKMAPFFKMYNSYGNNYEKAVELYSKCEKEPFFLEVWDTPPFFFFFFWFLIFIY